jgi:hypothetical protein
VTWVRIDDGYADHPKIVGLTPQARDLFIWGLCFCARQLTDGFIAHGAVRGCVLVTTRGGREKACAALVRADLWVEVEGGWQVHDFLDYNRNRAQVLKERNRNAARIARWRERKNKPRNASRNAVTGKGGNGVPDPTPPQEGEGSGDAASLEEASPPLPQLDYRLFKENGRPCYSCERHWPDEVSEDWSSNGEIPEQRADPFAVTERDGRYWCERCYWHLYTGFVDTGTKLCLECGRPDLAGDGSSGFCEACLSRTSTDRPAEFAGEEPPA